MSLICGLFLLFRFFLVIVHIGKAVRLGINFQVAVVEFTVFGHNLSTVYLLTVNERDFLFRFELLVNIWRNVRL